MGFFSTLMLMPKFLLHCLFLVASVSLAFFWTSNPALSFYTLQLTALFVLLYFVNQAITRRSKNPFGLVIDATIFTLVVLLLVTSTGGLTSPVFFLIYFLLFGLALLFEPAITVALTLLLVIFFILTPTSKPALEAILQLFSLVLITPLALYFGSQYLRLLEKEDKIKILKQEVKISDSQIEKQETDTLLWLSLNLRKTTTEVLDDVAHLLADIGRLSVSQKERLLKIRAKLLGLLQSGEKLKKEVDETTD